MEKRKEKLLKFSKAEFLCISQQFNGFFIGFGDRAIEKNEFGETVKFRDSSGINNGVTFIKENLLMMLRNRFYSMNVYNEVMGFVTDEKMNYQELAAKALQLYDDDLIILCQQACDFWNVKKGMKTDKRKYPLKFKSNTEIDIDELNKSLIWHRMFEIADTFCLTEDELKFLAEIYKGQNNNLNLLGYYYKLVDTKKINEETLLANKKEDALILNLLYRFKPLTEDHINFLCDILSEYSKDSKSFIEKIAFPFFPFPIS